MHFIAENLKTLRKGKGWTQTDLARHLGVKRSLIGAYEEGRADPKLSLLNLICEKFEISLDQLITKPIGQKTAVTYYKGRSLRLLPISIESKSQKELAVLVPIKAAAGYLTGYGDVEYIERLPTFELPFPELSKDKTYRVFQIQGDSMLPISSGTYVMCSYVLDWVSIKSDECYIVLSKSDGIVFKRVLNHLTSGYLTMKSDNPEYNAYELPADEILEVWRAEGLATMGQPRVNSANNAELLSELAVINKRLDKIERALDR